MTQPTKNKNYGLLLISQFLSAFGDNVILAIIIGQLTFQRKNGLITEDQLRLTNAFYTSVLFIPYVLLAPVAGYLNDRYAKTRWLMGGNLLKLTGSLVAMTSIWMGFYWQAIGYFIVGIGSCFYGPAKYGILPELLPRERLVKANGTVELLTLLAILAGPITGAKLIDKLPVLSCYFVLMGIFVASLACNLFMSQTPFNPDLKLKSSVAEFFGHFKSLLLDRRVCKVLLGTGLFWSCGAVLKINFQPWGMSVFKMTNNTDIAKLGLWLGIGVLAGCFLAGQFHKVGDLRVTRRYGLVLAALLAAISFIRVQGIHVNFLLILIGMAAGLFLIPLNAALQDETHANSLGKTIAVQNFVDNIAMIVGGLFVQTCVRVKLAPEMVFMAFAIMVALAMVALRFPDRKTEVQR